MASDFENNATFQIKTSAEKFMHYPNPYWHVLQLETLSLIPSLGSMHPKGAALRSGIWKTSRLLTRTSAASFISSVVSVPN